MRVWTKAILQKKYPNVPFDEEAFLKGFKMLDATSDGKVNRDDIRKITINRLKRESLYSEN